MATSKIVFYSSLAATFALFGCVSHPELTWTDTQAAAYSTEVPDGRSSIIVYRTAEAIDGPTTNVFVNGEYLASLQPGAYRQETVCSQNQRLHTEFTGSRFDAGYRAKATQGQYYNLPDAAVAYFKVVNQNGQPALQAVEPQVAQQELQGLPRQNHTLSRVDHTKGCQSVLKKYNLQASALFQFDRSDYANMLPKGKQEIAEVSQEIKANPNRVERIVVIGHTDPAGTPAYNQRLSEARANTVKRALAESGIDSSLISAEGKGEQQLLVADCKAKFPRNAQARKACDQPNRRVEIILHGQRAQ